MRQSAALLLEVAAELRAHAARGGHDANASYLFAHRILVRALAARADLALILDDLTAIAASAASADAPAHAKAA